MNTNTTLETLIRSTKCRKGKATAITAKGAYWLAIPPIKIRRFGGDGIGNDSPDRTNTLELRHYRDGKVRTMIKQESWHQNHGNHSEEVIVSLNFHTTAEEVIVTLKNHTICDRQPVSDYFQNDLIDALVGLGLPEYEVPSPDDEPATTPA